MCCIHSDGMVKQRATKKLNETTTTSEIRDEIKMAISAAMQL